MYPPPTSSLLLGAPLSPWIAPHPAGLLVVSTRVGGVPEVLPEDMLLLAEPSPEGVVDAVDAAVERLRAGGRDAWAQHAVVRDMYSWQAIAQRTERVYRAVLLGCACGGCDGGAAAGSRAETGKGREGRQGPGACGGPGGGPGCAACGLRDDSIVGRLLRYHKCGAWFGKICCCVTGGRQRHGLHPLGQCIALCVRHTCLSICRALSFRARTNTCTHAFQPARGVSLVLLLLAAVDWLYWRFLEWWQPASSIEPAPDFPPLHHGQAC